MTRPRRTATRLEHLLARGGAAVRDWPAAWLRRHPVSTDCLVAAVVLAVTTPPISAVAGRDRALSLALVIALACPLVWRRRAPFGVFALMTALALVQLLTTPEATDDVALLVAFYTVAAYQPRRRVLAAAAVLEAGAVVFAFTVSDVLQVWATLSALVAGAGFLGYYARTRRAYLAALLDRASRLERERDQQAQLAAAAERARIAREVHDIVAHNIAVMIALANGASYTAVASPEQTVSLLDQISGTGRSALAEMRRLLGVLREPGETRHAPQPTLADIDDLLAAVRSAGLPAALTVTGQPCPLPATAQLALYRMIQEALTNTLKHAPGATAHVHLTYLPDAVELAVTDDGRPPARPGAAGPVVTGPVVTGNGGHGIAGMRERAAVFGGHVSAGPCPEGGWRVHTVLQLDSVPARNGTSPVGAEGA